MERVNVNRKKEAIPSERDEAARVRPDDRQPVRAGLGGPADEDRSLGGRVGLGRPRGLRREPAAGEMLGHGPIVAAGPLVLRWS